MNVATLIRVFNQSIEDYHRYDDVAQKIANPYPPHSMDYLAYEKNWIDTVQWHLEDLIRNPHIDSKEAVQLKRSIDQHNQWRTDKVEALDGFLFQQYQHIPLSPSHRLNTETLGWAIDRLSILCLKIYHMAAEVERKDADMQHTQFCQKKLEVLLLQQTELSLALDQFHKDLMAGNVRYVLYKQMKMYNDPSTNPILYSSKPT